MVFCNIKTGSSTKHKKKVTILILIDGFLQFDKGVCNSVLKNSHNPYFNRWFSAIFGLFLPLLPYIGHNPYFNRWFSAITF